LTPRHGWQLYCDRLDKEWSLTDCVSIAVMERDQIKEAFTSDHHFEQAGFIKIIVRDRVGFTGNPDNSQTLITAGKCVSFSLRLTDARAG